MTNKPPVESITQNDKAQKTSPTARVEKNLVHNSFRDWIIHWREVAPWLILIITAAYSFISYLQWSSLQTQMGLMKISTIPYIGVKEINIKSFEVGKRLSVDITWVNGGQTPAYNISVESHIASLLGPITKDYILDNINLPEQTCGFLPAGQTSYQEVFSPIAISDEWLTRLNNEDLNLYVYGTAKYYDPFDRTNAHQLNFCAKYEQSKKQFVYCSIHNESR